MKVGTRGSRLALAQTRWVIGRLSAANPGSRWEEVAISTSGDRGKTAELGDGIFVKEIQRALLDGEIDLAVHSLKDLPTEPVDGLVVVAVPERGDPREALVGGRLDSLAAGAGVGTGSPRRVAQLRHLRPDLRVVPMRGNVPTRVEAVREGRVDAALLAAAGLERLGLPADDVLPPDVLLPAPGQGALAVETRSADTELLALASAIHDPGTAAAVTAERALLRSLGGGCLLPVGTFAQRGEDDSLRLVAAVTAADGSRQVRAEARGSLGDAAGLGARVAERLVELGGLELLEEGGA